MAEEAPKSIYSHAPTSNADLMASAKTVAEAAQLACNQKTDQIDKAKVAGAAEDVLEATKTYGKLDETSGAGKYVDKAEDYLHKYHTEGGEKAKEETNVTSSAGAEKAKEETNVTSSAGAEKESGGGGIGGVMNMAKGLFGK